MLNFDKCQAICFCRKIEPSLLSYTVNLKAVATVKYLGVLLDNKLTFVLHIELIIYKANRALGRIKKFSGIFMIFELLPFYLLV